MTYSFYKEIQSFIKKLLLLKILGTIFENAIVDMPVQSSRLKLWVALLDLITLVICYYLVLPHLIIEFGTVNISQSLNFVIASVASWLFAASFIGVYSDISISDYKNYNRNSLRAYFLYLLIFGFVLFFIFHTLISRNLMLAFMGVTLCALLMSRLSHLAVLKYYRTTKLLANRVVVLGEYEKAKEFASYLKTKPQFYEVVGLILARNEVGNEKKYTNLVLGSETEFIDICEQFKINEVFCLGMPNENPVISSLYARAEMNFIKMRFVPNFNGFILHKTKIDFLGNYPVLSLRTEPLEHRYNQVKKRIFDIVFSFLVIVLLFSWLFPIMALLIKLGSKGPVFFVQKRSGKNNITFRCVKFRSMKVNNDANLLQASANDYRLTKLGKFMRKTNLDELPQFFNVLLGDMSVVGPRPHMLKHTEQYSKLISQYMLRHWLKPGITGWAQVNGYRGETKEVSDMEKRVEFDIWYGENWNFYLDLRIIWLTVFNTVKGDKKAF